MDMDALRQYFTHRTDVAFAFLFGSQSKDRATRLSDVDIAVYFYPEKRRPVEFQEQVFYETEDEIWTDMEGILHKEVDLLVLNRAPSVVAASAIRGIPLSINDLGLYLDFMEVVTSEADSFMEFTISGYKEREALAKGI